MRVFTLNYSSHQPSGRQSKPSCGRKEDCQKFSKPNVTCTEPSKKKTECHRESKCESSAVCGKILRERIRERCSGRKKNSCRSDNKKCQKSCGSPGKRQYSQLSFLSNCSRDRAAFYGFILDNVVRDSARASDTTRRFFASCDKGRKDDSRPHCEKPKKTCEEEAKKKCTAGPAKCLSKKSVCDKPQDCTRSAGEEKKPCDLPETPQKCTREQYCASRKGFVATDQADEQPSESLS